MLYNFVNYVCCFVFPPIYQRCSYQYMFMNNVFTLQFVGCICLIFFLLGHYLFLFDFLSSYLSLLKHLCFQLTGFLIFYWYRAYDFCLYAVDNFITTWQHEYIKMHQSGWCNMGFLGNLWNHKSLSYAVLGI